MVFTIPFVRNWIEKVTGRPSLDHQSVTNETKPLCKTPSPFKKRASASTVMDDDIGSVRILNHVFLSDNCMQHSHHVPKEQDPISRHYELDGDLHDDFTHNDLSSIPSSSTHVDCGQSTNSIAKIKKRKFKQTSVYTGPHFSLMRSFVRESFPKCIVYEEPSSILFDGSMDMIPTHPTLNESNDFQRPESSILTCLLIESKVMKNNHSPGSPVVISDNNMVHSIKSHGNEICVVHDDNIINKLLCQMSVNVGGKENDHQITSLETHSRIFESFGEEKISDVTTSSVVRSVNSTTGPRKDNMHHIDRISGNTTTSNIECASSIQRRPVRGHGYLVTPRIQSFRSNKETFLENDAITTSVFRTRHSRPEHLMSPCTQKTKSTLKRYRLERIAAPQSRKRHARTLHHPNSPVV